jgi:hypothetical protein
MEPDYAKYKEKLPPPPLLSLNLSTTIKSFASIPYADFTEKQPPSYSNQPHPSFSKDEENTKNNKIPQSSMERKFISNV